MTLSPEEIARHNLEAAVTNLRTDWRWLIGNFREIQLPICFIDHLQGVFEAKDRLDQLLLKKRKPKN